MTIEDKIKTYLEKVKALKEIEAEIQEIVPDYLLEQQEKLSQEVESDKSVIQKEIKSSGVGIEVEGLRFKMSTRTRSSVSPDFMYTAVELGHIEELIKIGLITDVKVNEDMIERLEPEMAGIYRNLIVKKPYQALTWPKKADK